MGGEKNPKQPPRRPPLVLLRRLRLPATLRSRSPGRTQHAPVVMPSVCHGGRCTGARGRTAHPLPNAFCTGAEVPGPLPTGSEEEPVGSFESRPNGGVPHVRGRRLALPWAQRPLPVSWARLWDTAVSTCARHSARGFVLLTRQLPPSTHKRPVAPSSGHGGAAPGPELTEPFPNSTCICFSSFGGWVFPELISVSPSGTQDCSALHSSHLPARDSPPGPWKDRVQAAACTPQAFLRVGRGEGNAKPAFAHL